MTQPNSIPGWIGPIMGPVVCASLAWWALHKGPQPPTNEFKIGFVVGAAVLGLLIGLFFWWRDSGPESPAGPSPHG